MNKSLLVAAAISAWLSPAVRASVTINAEFSALYQANGLAIGIDSVGILVADENSDGVIDPTNTILGVGNYVGGNAASGDRIVALFPAAASPGGTGSAGFSQQFVTSYDEKFTAGNRLYLLWFPASAAGATISPGASYGRFQADVPNSTSNSDIGFVAPADGSTNNLFAYSNTDLAGSPVTPGEFTATFTAGGAAPGPAPTASPDPTATPGENPPPTPAPVPDGTPAATPAPTPIPAPIPAPTLSLAGKKKIVTAAPRLTLKGKAVGAVTSVTYRIGNGPFKRASGTTTWTVRGPLKPGKNIVRIVAQGPGGESTSTTVVVTRKRP